MGADQAMPTVPIMRPKLLSAERARPLFEDNRQAQGRGYRLLKKLIAKLYSPLIVHQAWLALDPPSLKIPRELSVSA
jgi:hypothetical protein